jgi:hypothetical protein
MRRLGLIARGAVAIFIVLLLVSSGVRADTTDTAVYGAGDYGGCSYGSCTLTLTSDGATSVDVVPTPAGKCTVQKDAVSVLTNSTTGYTLTAKTSTGNNDMTGASASITASSATPASPTILAMNTWGYRVDNLAGFGAGPTSAQNSGSVPSVAFAAMPASDESPTAIASSSGAANPAQITDVWYGVCADSSLPSDTYTTTVVYTAVTN